MFCSKCGSQIEEGYRFCSACGTPVDGQAQPSVAPARKIKYEIKGGQLPVVVCHLEAGESVATGNGAMSWMSANMQMETQAGELGKVFGRVFTGEALALNHYTAVGGPGLIAFSSKFPGEIRALDIHPGQSIICQKGSFLAAELGVDLSIHFQKNLAAGFFGGEGFIMQKLSGNGTAFVEIDGSVEEYDLRPGETMIISTGYLAMMEESVTMDVVRVQGLKNIMLGGEGLFHTTVTGPGRIWVQTMPISTIARTVLMNVKTK